MLPLPLFSATIVRQDLPYTYRPARSEVFAVIPVFGGHIAKLFAAARETC